jgi:hypothetical protein
MLLTQRKGEPGSPGSPRSTGLPVYFFGLLPPWMVAVAKSERLSVTLVTMPMAFSFLRWCAVKQLVERNLSGCGFVCRNQTLVQARVVTADDSLSHSHFHLLVLRRRSPNWAPRQTLPLYLHKLR